MGSYLVMPGDLRLLLGSPRGAPLHHLRYAFQSSHLAAAGHILADPHDMKFVILVWSKPLLIDEELSPVSFLCLNLSGNLLNLDDHKLRRLA